MTPLIFLMILGSECCAVIGQVLFKHAMSGEPRCKAAKLTIGVAAMAVGFFLWLGLMSRFDLSKLYPFDGLNRIVLVFAAWIFLREKMSVNLWVGVLLICAGVLLVSAS